MADDQGKGWHGDPQGHAQAGSQSSGHTGDPEEHAKAGHKGGKAAQDSGNAHDLTDEERSEGGSHSGGNFKNDPQRASDAGRQGGQS
ncbi:MAG: general stress protein [Candidatus Levyibacteriota bacterium]